MDTYLEKGKDTGLLVQRCLGKEEMYEVVYLVGLTIIMIDPIRVFVEEIRNSAIPPHPLPNSQVSAT